MRKVLFAVVLVAASFAGGAVVNGPGLQWAQSMVLGRLGMAGDADPDAGGPIDPSSAQQAEDIPARPIPPLVVDPSSTPSPAAVPAPSSKTKASRSTANASTLPGLAPVEETTPLPLVPLTTARDREREALAQAAASAPSPEPAKGVEAVPKDNTPPPPKSDASVKLVSLANTIEPSASSPSPAASSWAEVRKSLQALGVSRYGTEGEPGGRVRFYCVIPLAGRRAVSQHFEAEGDDDLEAARAALRRVALWRATEAGGNNPE